MPTVSSGGASVRAEIEVRNADGTLRVKMFSPKRPVFPREPDFPKCQTAPCINAYIKLRDKWEARRKEILDEYQAIVEYHTQRILFAEKHKHDVIPEKYRTGEASPRNKAEAVREIAVLNKLEQFSEK